ncbi:5531_t:CDS:2, partial [Entrophospora sp. SA101]
NDQNHVKSDIFSKGNLFHGHLEEKHKAILEKLKNEIMQFNKALESLRAEMKQMRKDIEIYVAPKLIITPTPIINTTQPPLKTTLQQPIKHKRNFTEVTPSSSSDTQDSETEQIPSPKQLLARQDNLENQIEKQANILHRIYNFMNSVSPTESLNSYAKQQQLVDMMNSNHIDCLGLSETKIANKNSKHIINNTKITKHKGRVIYIDLFLKGKIKLQIIQINLHANTTGIQQEIKNLHEYIFKSINSELYEIDTFNTDHKAVYLNLFPYNLIGNKQHATLRQQQMKKTIFHYDKMTKDEWDDYGNYVDKLSKDIFPTLISNTADLNRIWDSIQKCIKDAAKKKIWNSTSTIQSKEKKPQNLTEINGEIRKINKIIRDFNKKNFNPPNIKIIQNHWKQTTEILRNFAKKH